MVLIHKLPLVIVTVISITSTSPVSGSVRFLNSPLTATGRNHTCPEEPQIFICQVDGSYMRWTFDSNYRADLFHDYPVNTVRIVSGQHGIRAVLIGNDAILESSSTQTTRRLKSALIIESTSALRGDVHNLSCSSNTASQVHQIHVAEIPNRPLNVRVVPVQQSNHTSKPIHRMLNVSWDVPDNIEQFDLERYKVHASILQLKTGNQYNYSNGTDSNYGHFFFLLHHHFAHITVTAVSKCLKESAESDPVELAASVGEAERDSFSVILPTQQATTNNVKAAAHDGSKDLLPSSCTVMMSPVVGFVFLLSTWFF